MNNIFQGAKFGDKFLTRDGRKAILIFIPQKPEEIVYILAIDNKDYFNICINCFSDGTAQRAYFTEKDDIVTRYKEPIDEKKLDELAQKYIENIPIEDLEKEVRLDNPDGLMKLIYKAGYRKSREK